MESLDLEVPTEAAPYATVPSKAEITQDAKYKGVSFFFNDFKKYK